MSNSQWHYERAVGFLSAKQWDAALEAFGESYRLDPTFVEALSGVAYSLDALGKRREAAQAYEEVIRLAPDLPSARSSLGTILEELGEFGEAEFHLRKAIELDPSDPLPQYNLGLVLHDSDQHGRAVEAYRRAISLFPDYWEAYDNLSTCLGELGRWSDAIRVLEEQRARRPEGGSALTYYNLGIALRAAGRLDEAVAASGRCLDLDPQHAGAHATLAGALGDHGRWPEAITHLREVVRIRGSAASASDCFNLGVALAEGGNLEEAEAALERAVALGPDDSEALLRLGAVRVESGKPEAALPVLEDAIRRTPRRSEAYGVLGAALHEVGRSREAVAAFQRAELEDLEYFKQYPAMRRIYEAAQAAADS